MGAGCVHCGRVIRCQDRSFFAKKESERNNLFCNCHTIHLLWRFDVVVVVALAANAALFAALLLLLSAVLSAVQLLETPHKTALKTNRQKGRQTPSINPY